MTQELFNLLMYCWIGIALLLLPVQLKVTAPYGRHTTRNWGILIPNKVGWMLMEIVSPICLLAFFFTGPIRSQGPELVFVGLWSLHYLNRSVIYPLRTRTSGQRIPLLIVLSAVFFNMVNASSNGYYLGYLSPGYPPEWLADPRFILGSLLFVTGAGINIWSDEILLRLRSPGETGYQIPKGGLFRYVSCPNLFGEIIEWTGFAVLCWNLPALAFATWTAANLIPRALSHHKWYREKFTGYPGDRKAIFPGLL